MNTAHFERSRIARGIGAMVLGFAALAAHAETRVLVNPGDQVEGDRVRVSSNWKSALESSLRKVDASTAVQTRYSSDATADLSATRANLYEVMVAPAPTIGSAVRYGYVPVVGATRGARAVLVAPADSAIGNWAQSKGRQLGMPGQDSVVTYLLRGEVQAGNTTLPKQYASIYQTRFQDALLVCLEVRRCDVVAVEKTVAQKWIDAGKKVKIVWESREVPGLAVALRGKDTRVQPEALRTALLAELERAEPGAYTAALTVKDFEYVSTLGYFTPRALEGATLVEDPAVVEALLAKGARYIDTRNAEEFGAGHVPGATLVPYVEKSAKDPGYDAAQDQFDVQRLGADKAQVLVFGCNGPECWKSFKASHAALKAGYTHVYWFRTGFPSWRASGRKFNQGAAAGTAKAT
ncbi:PhnD/SsuA/transferrin family substrate-binding protein [Ottowia sp.]|uniref:PhnD/SsuA/transferrin family substrate-binding protein n=1 Tax=Ottowia sp. TaxID=1898956 RepID=UPI002C8BA6BA|nr:rhodanese-like domain-containing protein [Ottowia sp.]